MGVCSKAQMRRIACRCLIYACIISLTHGIWHCPEVSQIMKDSMFAVLYRSVVACCHQVPVAVGGHNNMH